MMVGRLLPAFAYNLALLLLLTLAIFMPVSSVFAIDDPDNIEILRAKVFQNLWETGDQLYVVEYDVEYAVEPDEDAEDTFVFQIYDGATLMAQTPIQYYQSYLVAIYRDADDSLVWGSSYVVRIGGNFAIPFPSGTPEEQRSLSSTDWIEGAETASQTLLGTFLIQIAADLEDRWGGTITLLNTENKLNSTGAVIFGEVIPGLIDICPDIYETATEQFEFEANTTPTALQTGMTAEMSGRLQTALDDFGDILGLSGTFLGGVALAILFFILAGRIFTATNSVTIAIVVSIPLIFLANIIGLLSVAITWAMIIVVLVVFGIVFILGRLA